MGRGKRAAPNSFDAVWLLCYNGFQVILWILECGGRLAALCLSGILRCIE